MARLTGLACRPSMLLGTSLTQRAIAHDKRAANGLHWAWTWAKEMAGRALSAPFLKAGTRAIDKYHSDYVRANRQSFLVPYMVRTTQHVSHRQATPLGSWHT